MTKYLISRILRSVLSVVLVVAVVMLLVFSLIDREQAIAQAPSMSHYKNNALITYKQHLWEEAGYLDYVPYSDFLKMLLREGEITQEQYNASVRFADKASQDTPEVKEMVARFTEYYESRGYEVIRKDAQYQPRTENKYKAGGEPVLFATKDIPVYNRLWTFFSNLITIDNIHYAKGDVGERGISFTWYDPAYGGDTFAPAIMGNGTKYKYLFYTSNEFPFIHQNLVKISLGKSMTFQEGVDVFDIMTKPQGNQVYADTYYPSGNVERSADDLHSLTYMQNSFNQKDPVVSRNYVDDYTYTVNKLDGMSKMGYSFVIGIISVILAYLLAIPLGILMARKKDTFVDTLGNLYIIFIIAVPSLAYIFLFREIGSSLFNLPRNMQSQNITWPMYVLPIISLALPSVAGLMKWLRRYMIDQMSSDYVKFARSGGLAENEIFKKHVLKNAIIPIVHGIPGSVLGAMTGAIITEAVYVVPGAGGLLTDAINQYNNNVIIGLVLFYSLLSVTSLILGDVLMAAVDPRISFTAKER